jgi:ribosomal protein L10
LIIKGGIVEGKAVTDAEMKVIATLPEKKDCYQCY